MPDTQAELAALKHEAAPLVRHAVITIALILLFLLGKVGFGQLATADPKHAAAFTWLETLDVYLLAALATLFAIHMFLIMLLRLFSALRTEYQRTKSSA